METEPEKGKRGQHYLSERNMFPRFVDSVFYFVQKR